MPRPPSLNVDGIVEECKNIDSQELKAAIGDLKTDLWTRLSSKLDSKYSPKYLYVIFKGNRQNILEKVGLKTQLNEDDADGGEECNENDEDGNCSSTVEETENDSSEIISSDALEKRFIITLSKDEWKKIEPRETVYQSKDKSNPSRITRLYAVLPKESIWTSIINEHFWAHVKTPCRLAFKRAKVQGDGAHFLIIPGRCTECCSEFLAIMDEEPKPDSLALLQCTYKGDFDACRSTRKRKMRGTQREELAEKFVSSNESASFFRGKLLNANLQFGDLEPSHIPTDNALRVMRSKVKKKEALHSDPVQALRILKYTEPFNKIIHNIGAEPFSVYYWTNSQVSVWNSYCSQNVVPSIGIDGTGELIQEIRRPFSNVSKHIFLYSVCVYEKETKSQYSICNMLSERHTGITILNFLNSFFKQSGPIEIQIPKEAVCDHSVALLTAIVQCFTHHQSLKEYLGNCAKILVDPSKVQKPACYVRCDVAHTVKIIASWHPLKGVTWRTRQFYIRSVCLLIQCSEIRILEEILYSILVVALSQDGGLDATGKELLCEEKKDWLKRRISTAYPDNEGDDEGSSAGINIGGTLVNLTDTYDTNTEELSAPRSETADQPELTVENVSFERWGKLIQERAEKDIEEQRSKQDNMQYLPKLCECVLKLIETLPLWSAIMQPIFNYGAQTASTAYVESSFNDVKHRMLGHIPNLSSTKLPADSFLMYHIPHIEQTLLVRQSRSSMVDSVIIEKEGPGNIVDDPEEVLMDTDMAETSHSKVLRTESSGTDDALCPLCEQGHTQEGSHKCIHCNVVVHIIFEQCGAPLEGSEEGHGQQAVCAKCSRQRRKHPVNICNKENDSSITSNTMDNFSFEETQSTSHQTFHNPICTELRSAEAQNETNKTPDTLNCPLCVQGHTQEGSNKCIHCNAVVHIIFKQCGVPLEGSEEGHGQQAVCAKCLRQQRKQCVNVQHMERDVLIAGSTNGQDNVPHHLPENAAVENWRGKGLPLKKRKRLSYLVPNPDFMNVNLSSKAKPNPTGLLLNGLMFNELQPVLVSKKKYILTNTCAYDSIIQLLACAYSDSVSFRSFVCKQPSQSELWKTVKHMNKNGVTKWPYRWRAQLLSLICKVSKLQSNIYKINAGYVVPDMFGKLLHDCPSITCKKKCTSSTQLDQFKKTHITLMIGAGEKGNLRNSIQDYFKPMNERCQEHVECTKSTTFEVLSNYVCIELETAIDVNKEIPQKSLPNDDFCDEDFFGGIELRLMDIPPEIQVDYKVFFLRGAVGLSDTGGKKNINVIGHYKSYCRRDAKLWELYNDLERKKIICREETKIKCELLLYTV